MKTYSSKNITEAGSLVLIVSLIFGSGIIGAFIGSAAAMIATQHYPVLGICILVLFISLACGLFQFTRNLFRC